MQMPDWSPLQPRVLSVVRVTSACTAGRNNVDVHILIFTLYYPLDTRDNAISADYGRNKYLDPCWVIYLNHQDKTDKPQLMGNGDLL
jgi:hypothetical protein